MKKILIVFVILAILLCITYVKLGSKCPNLPKSLPTVDILVIEECETLFYNCSGGAL